MIFLSIALLGLLATKFSSSKLVSFFLLFIIWSLYALSYDGYDLHYYEKMYDLSQIKGGTGYEILFVWLMNLFGKLGFTFFEFRYFTSALTVVLFAFAAWRYSKAPNIVLFLYLCFSAIFDATLIRHALAMSLTINFMLILFDVVEKRECNNITFLLILASFFIIPFIHSSYWVFLIFIPYIYFIRNYPNPYKVLVLVFICFFIFVCFRDIVSVILPFLTMREGAIEKIVNSTGANQYGIIYNILKYFIFIAPILYIQRFKFNNYLINDISNRRYALVCNFIIYINLFFAFILIAQYFSVGFSRLFRLQVFINYIYLSNIISLNNKNKSIYVLSVFYAVLLTLIMLFFEAPNTLNEIYYMHLNTNEILKIIRI